jgi:uncharacterized protein (TIGR03437 family)
MSFQVQSNGASATQNLTINTSNGSTTVAVSSPPGDAWLTVKGNPGGTTYFYNTDGNGNLTLPITANTTGLNTGQFFTSHISIQITGLPSSAVSFTVVLNVGTPTILSASPANLSFSAVQGASSGNPISTGVTISSSGQALNYTVSATTQTGGNWLLLSNTTGQTSNSTPGFQVYVNASSLGPGNYSGTVLVSSTTTGDTVSIAVTLSVNTGSALSVTGTLSNFVFQAGSPQGSFSAETQTLMIATSSGTLNYSVTTSALSGGSTNWLVPSSTGGTATTTPQSLFLSLSYTGVANLAPGTYTINIAIAPTGVSNPGNTTNVVATLIVSSNPLLSVNTRSISFSVPLGTTTSQQQTITVSSSGGSIPYSVSSNQLWLIVAPPTTGNTTQNPTFSVYVNAAGLATSQTPYTGILTVSPTNSDAGLYNIQIAVSLTVTSATTQILAGPDQVLFSYQTTKTAPAAQLVQLTSSIATGFSVTTTPNPGSNCPTTNWLTATPSQNVTPATLSISISTTGMTAGFCTGTVNVTYNNGVNPNTSVLIPVTVDIAATSLITVTPPFGFGVATASFGANSISSYSISINSTDGSPLGFSAYASTPNAPVSWLYLASSSGTTQQFLQVQIAPGGLAVGTYNGSITIHATNSANLPSGDLTIPVILNVSANTTVTVSPTTLSFNQMQNATTAPASQTVTLTATGGSTGFIATVSPVTGGNWLQVTPASGTASGTLSASVALNTLSPGTYTSTITLTFQNSATPTVTIPVSLTVTTPQTVTVAPTSLAFAYQIGAAAPPTQTLKVTSTGGAAQISVGTTSTTGWLSVTPTSGSTGTDSSGLTLTVSVAPATFTAAGTYTGTITITPTGLTAQTVQVTVTVTGVVTPAPATISNSASGAFGPIAVGELITIKGTNLGPATGVSFTVGSGNTVSSTLSGVQVLFDGIPGTPTYVSATQINAIVPYEIAGRATTTVTVSYQNQVSGGIPQTLASQAPGIYTFSATGAGQGAILNQNFTYNGPPQGLVINGQQVATSPAAVGSVIAVYMTGGGQTSPVSQTGTVTPASGTLYKIPGTVTATINGVPATVVFAGAAPSLVTGVVQVNIQIPPGVSGSALPLVISINQVASPSGVTVAVQ